MSKEEQQGINALGAQAAYNLANVTKTKPQYRAITPKWLTKLLEFKGLETGIYRVNKVVEGDTPLDVLCSQTKKSDIIPDGYVEYETEPREYRLNSISTIINVNTAIEDVYSSPYDQVKTQLELAKDKEENGVTGFLTQPVLTHQALENLKLARETLQGKILGGIIPIVSHRNAVFMNSEVSGITVAPEIIDRYEGLDREQGEALALELSRQIARDMTPYVDGYYLITPFGRTGLIARILEAMRKDGLI